MGCSAARLFWKTVKLVGALYLLTRIYFVCSSDHADEVKYRNKRQVVPKESIEKVIEPVYKFSLEEKIGYQNNSYKGVLYGTLR